jgi:hypothetical protein
MPSAIAAQVMWMTTDYDLPVHAASHLPGQVVRYDVGNVFDPAYTMVCSVPKEWASGGKN